MQPTQPVREVHVDGYCHILTDPALVKPGKKLKLRFDDEICNVDQLKGNEHLETRDEADTRTRYWVWTAEHEFHLQNTTNAPQTFIVEQPVPRDWFIDSDPRPAEMHGQTALFRIEVAPHRIVQLHVGMRREKAIGTKKLKKSN
jgi:hypothetical protein